MVKYFILLRVELKLNQAQLAGPRPTVKTFAPPSHRHRASQASYSAGLCNELRKKRFQRCDLVRVLKAYLKPYSSGPILTTHRNDSDSNMIIGWNYRLTSAATNGDINTSSRVMRCTTYRLGTKSANKIALRHLQYSGNNEQDHFRIQ